MLLGPIEGKKLFGAEFILPINLNLVEVSSERNSEWQIISDKVSQFQKKLLEQFEPSSSSFFIFAAKKTFLTDSERAVKGWGSKARAPRL